MTLCRLMIDDFENKSGRYDGDRRKENRRYSNYNLWFGIEYSRGLIAEGLKKEPFLGYDLKKFIRWAASKFQGRPKLKGKD